MCGICGIIDFRKASTEHLLNQMTDSLNHRGPDDRGTHIWEETYAWIGFGHRRLSILDLSGLGNQPMFSDDGDYAIVLNGEIYNFREIKKELEKDGFRFRSGSDTEVVLKAYICWGTNAVHRFIGMFAFSIYDRKQNKVLIFRDRAGVKPLYYYFKNNIFLFASELKSFHLHPRFEKTIDTNIVADFLKHGWIPAPHTIYQNCFKLKPGHFLELNLETANFRSIEYWNVLNYYTASPTIASENEILEEIESLMHSSFQYRMVADVPVGVFLSGGYDSTAVAALLQKNSTQRIRTYTIGFEDAAFDEAPYAKKVADYLGTEHQTYYCSQRDAIDLIPALPYFYDEPFADSSALPTTLVSREAAKYVKVALSADGGDELFCGYPRYYESLHSYTRIADIGAPFDRLLSAGAGLISQILPNRGNQANTIQKFLKVRKMLSTPDYASRFRYRIEPYHFKEFELRKLMNITFSPVTSNYNEFCDFDKNSDILNAIMAIEYKTTLVDDMLVKVDRASMSQHLECREPFLDHRLTEFMARVPSKLKFKNHTPKYLLKQIVHKYVPKEMMERPKMGFGIPTEKWLKKELKPMVCDLLLDSNMPFINRNELNTYITNFYANKEPNAEKVWLLLMLALWHNKWEKKFSL
ncbi:MAG: asparagine synthase (glutamine-hydrolyzing) [Bacteroidota bacterium]|jgi:asparagine synthase (glutamine-hydrolysing)|nr:asparagine synthase (glutamine-hydrolyzing) [Sphingobacteriales bacterium]